MITLNRSQHLELGHHDPPDMKSIQHSLETVLYRRVDVLEDGISSKRAYTKIFSDELGWQLSFLNSKHDVIVSADEGLAQIYILDNRIGNNATEGLEALQELCHRQSESLVAICSSYPTYRPQAYSICADLVAYHVKGTGSDLDKSICGLAFQFIERLSLKIDEIHSSISFLDAEDQKFLSSVVLVARRELKMEKEKLERLRYKTSIIKSHGLEDRGLDQNIIEFEHLKQDPGWLKTYNNRYVAFVAGQQVFEDVGDEKELRLLARQKYPNKRRFITKVQLDGDVKILKQPSGLSRTLRLKSERGKV
jgi:hypothetical protein